MLVAAGLEWLARQDADRGDRTAAVRRLRDEVDFLEQTYGKEDYRTGDAQRHIAYQELLQRLPANDAQQLVKAEQLYAKASELRQQGKHREALSLAEEVLQIQRRLLGDGDLQTAGTLNLIAAMLLAQGDYSRAEPLLRQVLATAKETIGENHPYYAASLLNLATVHCARRNTRGPSPCSAKFSISSRSSLGRTIQTTP